MCRAECCFLANTHPREAPLASGRAFNEKTATDAADVDVVASAVVASCIVVVVADAA